MPRARQGTNVPENVYLDGRNLFQAHSIDDAKLVVDAINKMDSGDSQALAHVILLQRCAEKLESDIRAAMGMESA